MSVWKRYRDAVVCVGLMSASFFTLRASMRDPGSLTEADRMVVRGTGVLQTVGAWIAHGLGDFWDDYLYLVHVRRDNERLRSEVATLRADTARYRSAWEENRRLRRLLQLRVETPVESFPAEVVALDVSPYFRVTRLAVNVPDGARLRVGMPVVSYEGVVGQVNGVVGSVANVTLVADSRMAVDAMLERTGARGILRGTGERGRYAAQVEYLQRTDDEVRIGDSVVTSGLGCRFPAGLLLGRVSAVTRREFGLYQEVEVTPAVDFSRLREALVLATPARDCAPGVAPGRRPARRGESPQ